MYVSKGLFDKQTISRNPGAFPLYRRDVSRADAGPQTSMFDGQTCEDQHAFRANLSAGARNYLSSLGVTKPDSDPESAGLIWMHALAIGYSPDYLRENADGIRQDWPRIPLPDTKEVLTRSAELGRRVAELLDTENAVSGVTSGAIRPELVPVGVVSLSEPGSVDLAVSAGWGHAGQGGVTMPGKGKSVRREYTPDELSALRAGADALGISFETALEHLGDTTFDIFLNDTTYWRNIPAKVWEYTIGGYQVIKKWLSYRERDLLGRPLTTDEAQYVRDTARRIAAIVLLEPELNDNYEKVKSSTYAWPKSVPTERIGG